MYCKGCVERAASATARAGLETNFHQLGLLNGALALTLWVAGKHDKDNKFSGKDLRSEKNENGNQCACFKVYYKQK